ncbi:NACHT, LRR and PYD domains-containing protein 1 homolog [Anarhichas minor]|uniref:NACHT, LRR and PYD domains-containing protein 1 homolog n=1 Tax=Anarhichas minor TaxID=65739 RepID=UPI003F73598C
MSIRYTLNTETNMLSSNEFNKSLMSIFSLGPTSEEHFVDKNKDYLIHDLRNIEHILDELLNKGVIQQESYDKISALSTSEEKIKELIDGHLKTVGSKDIFQDIAMENLTVLHQGPDSSSSMPSGTDDQYLKSGIFWKTTMLIPSGVWIQLEPEVNCVDSEDAPIYSLQSDAGHFECSVSGLRWVCKEKVSFKYQFGSWEEHMERLETMHYIPGGPLLDITVVAGKLDEAHLPHWICTKDNPTILTKFAVLHIGSWGDVVEPVFEVTPSHVKLSQPIFSPRGVLMRAGFPVKINCKVLIYKTKKAFLTLHVFLIPRDPALQQTIKNKELSSGYKMIEKPYPVNSLKMRDRFILTADMDTAEIYPEKLKLVYEGSDPNFFEVFIESPDNQFQLTMTHGSGPVWTCAIRKDDYQNTAGDIQVMYEEELAKVRCKLVATVSRELVNQLLDDLLEDRVLNEGEKDSILQENNTSADRARCLIDTVRRKGHEASGKIFTHLRSRDPTLSAQLGLPSGRPV